MYVLTTAFECTCVHCTCSVLFTMYTMYIVHVHCVCSVLFTMYMYMYNVHVHVHVDVFFYSPFFPSFQLVRCLLIVTVIHSSLQHLSQRTTTAVAPPSPPLQAPPSIPSTKLVPPPFLDLLGDSRGSLGENATQN